MQVHEAYRPTVSCFWNTSCAQLGQQALTFAGPFFLLLHLSRSFFFGLPLNYSHFGAAPRLCSSRLAIWAWLPDWMFGVEPQCLAFRPCRDAHGRGFPGCGKVTCYGDSIAIPCVVRLKKGIAFQSRQNLRDGMVTIYGDYAGAMWWLYVDYIWQPSVLGFGKCGVDCWCKCPHTHGWRKMFAGVSPYR